MIPCQRDLFDLPDDVAYLNCAYMSPLLKHAAAAGAAGIARKTRPWTISSDDFFADSERARALFAKLLGAEADDIALVPAASYGVAIAAANLPFGEGQRILMLAEQFPSNVYAWRELAQAQGRRGRDRCNDRPMATGALRSSPGSTSGSRSPPCRTATGPTAA